MKKVVITEDEIIVTGFTQAEFKGIGSMHRGTCRDLARVALAWGAMRISQDQHHDATGDWDSETCGIGD